MISKFIDKVLKLHQETVEDLQYLLDKSLKGVGSYLSFVLQEMDTLFLQIRDYFYQSWARIKPKIDQLSQATTVATTTTSTFKTSFELLPIMMSMLPVLTGIPVIGIILPEFFLTDAILYSFLFGISVYVGFLKYIELKERATLDKTIEENKSAIKTLTETLAKVQLQFQDHLSQCAKDTNSSSNTAPKAAAATVLNFSKQSSSPSPRTVGVDCQPKHLSRRYSL